MADSDPPSSCQAPAPQIAIIIPYFQQRPGILARALQAVFGQQDGPPVQVIIVDDGSPAPVEPELDTLCTAARHRITLLRQANQGPGPARNTGLSAVAEAVEFIAFLDSDDRWDEHHLAHAVSALQAGADLYFADGNLEDRPSGLFRNIGFDVAGHSRLASSASDFVFHGDFLAALLRHTPIITSSVVMRKSTLGAIRFPASRGTCEDLRFWLDLALTAPRVVFSTRIEVTGGRAGIHMSHRDQWKSNKSLQGIADFDDYYRHVLAHIPMQPDQAGFINQRANANRTDFLVTVLAMMKTGCMPDMRVVGAFIRRNPGAVVRLLSLALLKFRSGRPPAALENQR